MDAPCTRVDAPRTPKYADRIQRAIDYIEDNLSREVALDVAASHACWSTFHFMWTFNAVVGRTFGEYVRVRRMQIASYRLSFTTERILDERRSSLDRRCTSEGVGPLCRSREGAAIKRSRFSSRLESRF